MSRIQKELVELLGVKESKFEDRQEFLDEILELIAAKDVVDDKTFKGLSKATKNWYNTTVDFLEVNKKEDIPEFPDYEEGAGEDTPRRVRRRGGDEDEDDKPTKKNVKDEPDDEILASDCEEDEYYMVENADYEIVKAKCISVAKRVIKFETIKGKEEVCISPKVTVGVIEDDEPVKKPKKDDEKPVKRGRKVKKDDEDAKGKKGKTKSNKKAQMPDSVFQIVGTLFCENPDITSGEVIEKLDEEGHDFRKDSVYVYLCTVKKSYDLFKEHGLID